MKAEILGTCAGFCEGYKTPHYKRFCTGDSWRPLPVAETSTPHTKEDEKFAEEFVDVFGGFPKDQAIELLVRRQREIREELRQ